MADELPDDPRYWPRDPFELLGVAAGASETELKRAYTRLIRRFKPEHSPEQFRLVREAYEAALQGSGWRGHFLPPVPPPPTPPASPPPVAREPKPTEPEPVEGT